MATLIGLSSVFEPATARLRAAAPVGTINSNYALLSEVFVSIAVFISLLIMRRIDKTPLPNGIVESGRVTAKSRSACPLDCQRLHSFS